MSDQSRTVTIADIPADRRRGGEVRTILSPRTAGSTSGFMGTATIAPGDYIASHLHPYSEEFVLVLGGVAAIQMDADEIFVGEGEGFLIPPQTPHRIVNAGDEDVSLVFHLGPLAPRPDLGHVDLEERGDSSPGAR